MNSRRDFLKQLGLFSTAAFAAGAWRCASSHKFKNVILIIGDDHARSGLGCYGNQRIRTPHLDQMAAEGIRFSHAYANAPVCSASRQSLLTGKYPHAAGVTLLTTSFPEEQVTLAEHLKQYGYHTAVVGKTHFNNDKPHGFDERIQKQAYRAHLKEHPPKEPDSSMETRPKWKPFRDPARIWLNAESKPAPLYDQDTETTFNTEQAIAFVQRQQDNPFFLLVGYHEPHSPFNFPIEFKGKYKAEDMVLPETSSEDDRWIPEVFRDLTDDEKKGIIASYYTSTEYLDSKIGQIIEALKKAERLDDTLVLYLGDQGYLLGEHKRFEKHTMWEESIGAPLILLAGGQYGRGRVIHHITEFVDIVPTVLELLNLPAMSEAHGKSLLPVLKDDAQKHKDSIFCEFLCDNKAMIRTEEWKYIFTSGQRDLGQGYATGLGASGLMHKLYNMKEDPREKHDVASEAENYEILMELQQKMITLFRKTHPDADRIPKTGSVNEQLTAFCEPPDLNANLNAK